MTYNVYIDGQVVATYSEPLTRRKTLKQIAGDNKRRARDARLLKALKK